MALKNIEFTDLSLPELDKSARIFRYEFEVGMELDRTERGIRRALTASGCIPYSCVHNDVTSVTNLWVLGTRDQILKMQGIMACIDLD
jgi:hypothetical protein